MNGKYFATENTPSKYIEGPVKPASEEAEEEEEEGKEEENDQPPLPPKSGILVRLVLSWVFPVSRMVPDTQVDAQPCPERR